MKNNQVIKKYAILSTMKRIFKIIAYTIIVSSTLQNVGYCDTVISSSMESNGRIKTVSGGLIQIREGGSDLTYHREVNNEYFGDVVMYKKNVLSRKVLEVMGRIESLDRMTAVIYTPAGKIEVQRYKIKNIVMKVPSKGY